MIEKLYEKNKFISPPLQEIRHSALDARKIKLFVYRTDLRHPLVAGNKWYKLKYNIEEAYHKNDRHLLTFGGAFSNHIYVTAAIGALLGFKTSAFIRGEAPKKWSSTLDFARQQGMELHFVSRTAYRDKEALLQAYERELGSYYLLPEGGTNQLALKGCAEIVSEVRECMGGALPDYWTTACGTGGTVAGMLAGLKGEGRVIGFSVLKGGFMTAEVKKLLEAYAGQTYDNWQINASYALAGYARFTPELIQFIQQFHTHHNIPLDPVYNGKHFYGLFDLIAKDHFPKGSTIVAVHSGGLQGINGYNERYGKKYGFLKD